MPTDAKFGLIVGVAIVLVVAVVFFRKDGVAQLATAQVPAAAAVPAASSAEGGRGAYRQVNAKPTSQGEENEEDEGN